VNNCSYEREFGNKGITNPHGVFSGIARHNIVVRYKNDNKVRESVFKSVIFNLTVIMLDIPLAAINAI
jgi:hypothetical protein